MAVVYLDSVFLLNALMDYLLLLAAARLAGLPLRRWRYLAGALLGGCYAAAVFLPGAGWMTEPAVKLAFGVLMALMAYGGETKLLRLILLFFALSCGMAGCVLGLGFLTQTGMPMLNGILYTDVDWKVLLIASTAAYVVLRIVFHASAQQGVRGRLCTVKLSLGGHVTELTALQDTGNALMDPVTGAPVLVISWSALKNCLPSSVGKLLTLQGLRRPVTLLPLLVQMAPELHTRLLPYCAVGVQEGMLLALQSAWVEIEGQRHENLLIACSPTELGDGYSALWGGEIKRGGNHEGMERGVEEIPAASGPAAFPGSSLHWR